LSVASLILDLIFLISFIVQAILVIVFVREYNKKRVNMILLLVIAFGFNLLFRIFDYIITASESAESSPDELYLLFPLFFSIYLMGVFFEFFEKSRLNFKVNITYTFSLGFMSGFILLSPVLLILDQIIDEDKASELIQTHMMLISTSILLFVFLMIITAFIYFFVIPIQIVRLVNRVKKRVPKDKIKQYNVLLWGFILNFLGMIVPDALGEILLIIGYILIIWVFLKGESFLFIAHRLDNLILMSKNGPIAFNYEFPGGQTKVHELLLGGILSAITQSLQEITGSQELVQEIQFGDLNLSFRSVGKEGLILLISQRTSRFITESLDRFVSECQKKYENKFDSLDIINSDDFNPIATLVERIFMVKGVISPQN
jgi:hypothetical protein